MKYIFFLSTCDSVNVYFHSKLERYFVISFCHLKEEKNLLVKLRSSWPQYICQNINYDPFRNIKIFSIIWALLWAIWVFSEWKDFHFHFNFFIFVNNKSLDPFWDETRTIKFMISVLKKKMFLWLLSYRNSYHHVLVGTCNFKVVLIPFLLPHMSHNDLKLITMY